MSVRIAAMWSMAAQYVVFTTQFVVSVVISRYFLSPADFGLFSVALSAAMLVSILQDFGIARYISGQPDLSDQQVRTCFSVSLLFSLGVGLVILAMAWPVARFYDNPLLTPLLWVIAGSYLVVPFAIVPSALLSRRMDFRALFVVNVGAALANAAVALSMAAAGYGAFALSWALVAQAVARMILSQWLSRTTIPLRLSLAGAGEIVRFGSASSALYVSGSIGVRSPELIIGRLLSLTAVGLYGRAASLAGQLRTLVAGAIGGVFYPAFARLRDQEVALGPPYLRVVSGYTATVWPAMVMLAVAAAPLVRLLYGERWMDVAPILTLIALAELAFVALPLHSELPILLGRMRTLLFINILDTAVSVVLLVLACFWSLEWAAASRIAYGLIWYVLYAGFMRGLVGFRWRALLVVYAQSAAVTLATVTPLLLVNWQTDVPGELDLLPLASAAAAGGVAWLAAIYALKHPVRREVTAVLQAAYAAMSPRLGFRL